MHDPGERFEVIVGMRWAAGSSRRPFVMFGDYLNPSNDHGSDVVKISTCQRPAGGCGSFSIGTIALGS